jgi:hypothetical protein
VRDKFLKTDDAGGDGGGFGSHGERTCRRGGERDDGTIFRVLVGVVRFGGRSPRNINASPLGWHVLLLYRFRSDMR